MDIVLVSFFAFANYLLGKRRPRVNAWILLATALVAATVRTVVLLASGSASDWRAGYVLVVSSAFFAVLFSWICQWIGTYRSGWRYY